MQLQILKPGYLVSLKTTIKGGVQYGRQDIEPDHKTETGARRAQWQTLRIIPMPEEYEAAQVARSKARSLIVGACVQSSFGLLCPMENEAALWDAIAQARDTARAFNERSELSKVECYVLTGRIAESSAEAERAIASELRELLDAMKEGIQGADVAAIREAASKARAVGAMLSGSVQAQVGDAIAQARKAAREIAKRVEKAGESARAVIAELRYDDIERARFAFLDTDEAAPAEVVPPVAPAVDVEPDAHVPDELAAVVREEIDGTAPPMQQAAPALFTPQFEF